MVTDEEFEALKADFERLQEENEYLRKKVEELQSLLESKTLPKLPTFVKPNKKKRKGRRKRRGPPMGHTGAARPIPDEVDTEDDITLQYCPHCDNELGEPFEFTIHHVEEVIPAKVEIRRHCLARYICPCCKKTIHARVPDAFPNERFGIYLMVLVAYFRILGLTVGKIRALLKEQYSLEICDATVLRIEKRVAMEMGEHYDNLVDAVRKGKDVHIDETGWRVDGQNHWLWASTTEEATVYHVEPRRNGETANEILGPARDDRVISSDFLPTYNVVEGSKQKCLVHLIRELKEVEKKKKEDLEFARFKKKLMRLIRDAIRLNEKDLEDMVKKRRIQRLHKRLKDIYESDWSEENCQRLSKRLNKHKDELFTFLEHEGVQWHNNDAERAIRPMVVNRKNSYGSRSIDGANNRAVLMSVSESAKKRQVNFTDFTRQYLADKCKVCS